MYLFTTVLLFIYDKIDGRSHLIWSFGHYNIDICSPQLFDMVSGFQSTLDLRKLTKNTDGRVAMKPDLSFFLRFNQISSFYLFVYFIYLFNHQVILQ